ncbi:MAG TPA: DUF4340 domain-containing protein [Terriglobia bacterium]|nr:DUF4340 domain-containing protein [Terriglobia bacterium]
MKKQKFLNTLIALVVLAATWGAFTYYDKHKGSEKPAVETSHQTKIFSLDAQHIQSITFKPRDGDAFSCRREGGKWTITDPRHLEVDQGNFSGVLNSLTTATADEVVDPHPTSLKDFGLDPPSFSLEVTTDAKPQSFTLLLGDDTPTSGGLYAQASGNPQVFTLASYVKTSLEKKMFDLRDRRALTLDADQLQKIGVAYKGASWTLEKNPEGVWDLALPPLVRADRFTVDGLVSQLRGLTMQTIAAEDKKKNGDYGFGSPELRLQLTGSGGTQTIVVGKKDDKDSNRYFATNSALDPVFTLNSEFVTQFKRDQADLREKDLFSFSAFDVKRAEVDTPKGHWVFERQGNQWKQTAPKSKTVNSDKMDAFLTHLRDLRADSFPKGGSLEDFGLAKPAYRFNIQSGDKKTTEIVEAAKSGDHIYARRSTDPLPGELSKTALDDVEKSLGEL